MDEITAGLGLSERWFLKGMGTFATLSLLPEFRAVLAAGSWDLNALVNTMAFTPALTFGRMTGQSVPLSC